MPDEPPSILPLGTIIRPSRSPRPHPPASAVYIQSVSGFCCNIAHAAGIASVAGGGPPASSSATRTLGSSDRRAAITAPAEPPPTTTKSNESAMGPFWLHDGETSTALLRRAAREEFRRHDAADREDHDRPDQRGGHRVLHRPFLDRRRRIRVAPEFAHSGRDRADRI